MLASKSKVGQREVVQGSCNSLPSDLQLISAPRVPNILNENAGDISKYIMLVELKKRLPVRESFVLCCDLDLHKWKRSF